MILNFISATDLWFENVLLSVRTPFLLHIFNDITFFGNTVTVMGITGLLGVFLLSKKYYRSYIAGLAVALTGAAASAYVLKEVVGRVRPGGLIPSVVETSYSFPSGHATASIALYGFIAFLLCRLYPRHYRATIAVAVLITLSIGFSRLYLGLHFPSDVVVGYVVGGLWLWLGVKLTNRLQTRH